MSGRDLVEPGLFDATPCSGVADDGAISCLLDSPAAALSGGTAHAAVVGELLALLDGGRVPLVTHPGHVGHAGLRARATLDLHGRHVGHPVVLVFQDGDPCKPIVIGVLHEPDDPTRWPLRDEPHQVEVDGERLVVTARGELVLRCGRSQITLRADGHVEIKGETVVSQAAAANRVRGGSVELN
jgi:hypothetical protein